MPGSILGGEDGEIGKTDKTPGGDTEGKLRQERPCREGVACPRGDRACVGGGQGLTEKAESSLPRREPWLVVLGSDC